VKNIHENSKILLDTNVILDIALKGEPFVEHAT